MTCSFDPCDRPKYAKGLCNAHYAQARTGGELRPISAVRDVTHRNERGQKKCIRCDLWQHESEFKPASHTRDGLTVWCRACVRVGKYGLTRVTYDAHLARQGGVCAVCETPPSGDQPLRVDHDHECCDREGSCGKCVRGLLCDKCNLAIGLFGENPFALIEAVRYLEKWELRA